MLLLGGFCMVTHKVNWMNPEERLRLAVMVAA
jgi:hypothetical protein